MRYYQLFIPAVRDSDRVCHKPTAWQDFEKTMLASCGGFSVVGHAVGYWTDDAGIVVRDTSKVYGIACDNHESILALAYLAKTLFDQRTIFVVSCGTADCV